MTIVIEPDGTFILTGKVTEAGGVGVAGATVEVIGGTPNQTITNSAGSYRLFGVEERRSCGSARRAISMNGEP